MLPIIKTPVIFQKDIHKDLKVAVNKSFTHIKDISIVPISNGEFSNACKSQPILFINKENEITPCALLGIKDGVNLFVDTKSQWFKHEYCPAFIRQYPFYYLNTGKNLVFGFDQNPEIINDKEGEALVDSNGNMTEFTQKIIDMLNVYQNDLERTKIFCQKLNELNLLVPFSPEFQVVNEKYKFDGFMVVDEKAFNKLSEKKKIELIKNGYYPLIIMHLLSINNLNKLVAYSLNGEKK